MIESPQAFVADRPHRTVDGKGEVSELDIGSFSPAARRGQDPRSSLVGHPAEAMIVGKPDGAVRGLVQKRVMRGCGQNKGGRSYTGIVGDSLKFELTWGEKENRAA